MRGSSFQARTTLGWLVRIALVIMLFVGLVAFLLRWRSPIAFALFNFLPVLMIALPLIAFVFWSRRGTPAAYGGMGARAEKPKRGESLSELMSILNDEDIDDLRGRVKARLEEQIDSADAEEIDAFAEMLDERKRKRGL